MKIEAKMQAHDWVNVYYVNEIMIVPHYIKKGIFVAPGGIEFEEQELINAGAIQSTSYLWPRTWAKEPT